MKFRRGLALIAAVSIGFSMLIGAAAEAGAAPAVSNTYRIQAKFADSTTHKSMCLDADSRANNGAVVSWVDCNGTSWQTWQNGDWPSTKRPVLINVGHPGYCLAANPVAYATILTLAPCDGSITQGWSWSAIQGRTYPTANGQLAIECHAGLSTHSFLKTWNMSDQEQENYWVKLT